MTRECVSWNSLNSKKVQFVKRNWSCIHSLLFLFAGGESRNTDFNERALDLRNCRRFTPFFGLFSSGEGRGLAGFLLVRYAGKRPIPYASIGNRTILSRGSDREWADFLCEEGNKWCIQLFGQCLGIVFTFTNFNFRRLSTVAN